MHSPLFEQRNRRKEEALLSILWLQRLGGEEEFRNSLLVKKNRIFGSSEAKRGGDREKVERAVAAQFWGDSNAYSKLTTHEPICIFILF